MTWSLPTHTSKTKKHSYNVEEPRICVQKQNRLHTDQKQPQKQHKEMQNLLRRCYRIRPQTSSSKFVSEIKKNKVISMMRGKSPRFDVEIFFKKLNFVAAIFDFWRPSLIHNGYLISLYSIYGNNKLYKFCYFYHKVNDRYTNFHILPILHNANREQLFANYSINS